MPAPVIITVALASIPYMLWIVYAAGRPAILDPRERHTIDEVEQ